MNVPLPVAQRERRDTKRRPSRTKYRCRLKRATEEGTWIATVRNISIEGIGLIANRAFKPGMSLTMELPTDVSQVSKPVLVHVTHARPQPGSSQWWVLGGAFSRKLTKEELDHLRARSPSIIPRSERRTLVRHTTRLKSPCPVIRTAEEGPWYASIRNVSLTGIGLIANRPFRAGTLLTVELPTKTGMPGKPRLLRVAYSRAQPGKKWWVLGGTFTRPLSAEEIAALA